MAVVLNFNLVCYDLIDLNRVLKENMDPNWDLSIEEVSCINNWMWENLHELQGISLIRKELDESRIVIIHLKSSAFKDVGIYIERVKDKYVYDFWVNTEGYKELDVDVINSKNTKYYQVIYELFGNIFRTQSIKFLILGIGLETKFQFEGDVRQAIEKSENVIVWIVDQQFGDDMIINGYAKRVLKGMNFCVFEKVVVG